MAGKASRKADGTFGAIGHLPLDSFGQVKVDLQRESFGAATSAVNRPPGC
jgi:hypothetical protein